MPIPPAFIERIKASSMSGCEVANTFRRLAEAADALGMDNAAVTLEFVGDADAPAPGDLLPTITFALVRHQTGQPIVAEAATDVEVEE